MAILELRLLGGYAGTLASGDALRLPTRKAWALLSYLALHPGRELSREQLAALLWGERFDEQARASLRQTLYELRSALGQNLADRLMANRDAVVWHREGVEVDALRFEDLASRDDLQDLTQAAALYRGPLLDGLAVDEPDFETWLAAERARLEDVARRALERLASAHLDRHQSAAAVETAQRLVRLDPLSEKAHRLRMHALAADGRRSEALRHFRDLERTLDAELGVAPDPETTRLRDELLRHGEAVPPIRAWNRPRARRDPAATAPASLNPDRPRKAGSWRAIIAASLLSLAVSAAGLWLFHLAGPDQRAAVAPASQVSRPLADKPSIAVLPFSNLSGDPQQDYIASGLTEDLIAALSKTSRLLVVARTSVAGYKDRPVKVQGVADDLGVRYVLEGSVQRSGDDLRITTQLIDAVTGHHLWSGRFDREAGALFAIQDDIVRRVLVELQIELTDGEHARVASRGTTNLDAWLLRQQAVAELYKFTRESTIRTRALLQRAQELDPDWGRPLAGIAWSYWWEAKRGWADDREAWIRKGIALAEQAIEMDPKAPLGYMQLGNLYQLRGDYERGIALRKKAVDLAPGDFQANWGLGSMLMRAGQPERAVDVLKYALRLSPRPPASLVWTLAHAQLFAENYQAAAETAKRARALAPDRDLPHLQLAAAYAALGRTQKAHTAAAQVRRTDPHFSVAEFRRQHADYKDQAAVDKLANLLIRAGLRE